MKKTITLVVEIDEAAFEAVEAKAQDATAGNMGAVDTAVAVLENTFGINNVTFKSVGNLAL